MYVRTITPMAGRASSERPSVAYRNRIESCTVSDIGTCKSSRCTVLRGTWSATRGKALIIVVILRANWCRKPADLRQLNPRSRTKLVPPREL